MKKTILIFGAFDRFNYGDLLFPLIIVKKLDELDSKIHFEYRFYGIIESDLSNLGGIPTKSIAEFYKDCNEIDNSIIIIAGGEVLNAMWSTLISFLSKNFSYFFRYYKKLLRGKCIGLLDISIQRYYKSPSKNPYVLSKHYFRKVNKVVYNSVGGPRDKHLFLKNFKSYKALLESDYFSIRDKSSFEIFKESDFNVKLSPDCAILMSELFSSEYIINRINLNTDIFNNKYIFFQISKNIGKYNIDKIVVQLTTIYKKYNLNIVLCPIGIALGHEDQIPLKLLHDTLKIPNTLIESPSIWDIMYLIANSRLYIGTSLHGIITAMSFSKPYIGIGKDNSKIDAYLNTWAVPELNKGISIEQISKQMDVALSISNKMLTENLKHQIELSNNSFKHIYSLIVK